MTRGVRDGDVAFDDVVVSEWCSVLSCCDEVVVEDTPVSLLALNQTVR